MLAILGQPSPQTATNTIFDVGTTPTVTPFLDRQRRPSRKVEGVRNVDLPMTLSCWLAPVAEISVPFLFGPSRCRLGFAHEHLRLK